MKTITEHDGKNVNMQVVGDLHKYPDGSVHTVKEGKAVWEEGGGGSGGGAFVVRGTFNEGSQTDGTIDKTEAEIWDAVDSGKTVYFYLTIEGLGNTYYSFSAAFMVPLPDESRYYTFAFGGIDLDDNITLISIHNGRFHMENYPLGSS